MANTKPGREFLFRVFDVKIRYLPTADTLSMDRNTAVFQEVDESFSAHICTELLAALWAELSPDTSSRQLKKWKYEP